MAGYMYLGNKKVCPAVLVGGSSETPNTLFKLGDNVTTVSSKLLYYKLFELKKFNLDVDFNNLEVVSGENSFGVFLDGYSGIGSITMKHLRVVSGNSAFYNAFYVSGSANITYDVDFSTIEELSGLECFYGTFSLSSFTEVRFNNLSVLTGSKALALCFIQMRNSADFYFPALNSQSFGSNTDQFWWMLAFSSNCTVHFPSNLQSVIGSWEDVLGGFRGTNTTVLFDLPATS